MFGTPFHILLAILGLGFLIFIHELGHYFMARAVGMRVLAFGIGFGRAIKTWNRDGVEWRLNWLPFGGYVRIAGMEIKKGEDPLSVPGGFFTKSSFDRIKVALAGPLVNILFAFLVFSVIWFMGGREKNFSDFTAKIGWIDPKSELFADGVRPGDEILSYDDHPFQEAKDHLYGPLTAGETVKIQGNKVNPETGAKEFFQYSVKPYPHPLVVDKELRTAGILQPASYIVYRPSKLAKSTIPDLLPGDRIVWMDGERIYSLSQLLYLLNEGKALLTIQRGNETLLRRVARVPIQEFKLTSQVKEELVDWQHEAGMTDKPISDLLALPYNLTYEGVVENRLDFIDKEIKEQIFPIHPYSEMDGPLLSGDQIVAVDGTAVKESYQIFYHLQTRQVNLIVLRTKEGGKVVARADADKEFDSSISLPDLEKISHTIGTAAQTSQLGELVLLRPITPKKQRDLFNTPEKQAEYQNQLLAKENEIEAIENSDLKTRARKAFKERQEQWLLGIEFDPVHPVLYNPTPFEMFSSVTIETWRSLEALITGSVSVKLVSGPIGIVQVVQQSWGISLSEGLFWLGLISLNLGYLNLLPLPVLDGGYILLFLYEIVTGRRIKPQSVERLVLPFAIMLILFILFVTFQDISRLLG